MPEESIRILVEHKLQESILRRMQGGAVIGTRAQWRAYYMYQYGHELALGLASLGLSQPIIAWVGKSTSEAPVVGSESVASGLATVSHPWVIPSLIFAVLWLGLRIFVIQGKLSDRIPLAGACRRELGSLEAELGDVLSDGEPLKRLGEIHAKTKEVVDRYFNAGAWPWPIGPDGCDEIIRAKARTLCDRHEQSWALLPVYQRQ
jgi:hypothetical protein